MPGPTTIHDLPSELIHDILIHSLWQETPQVRFRGICLKAFALVSRRFREESQRLLWQDVYIYLEAVGLTFLASGQTGLQRVGVLRLFGDLQWEGVSNSTARLMIQHARGVENLALWAFEHLDDRILEESSLCGESTPDP